MSAAANWSYTAKATVWRITGRNDFNDPTFAAPEIIDCDYQGGLSRKLSGVSAAIGDLGVEKVVKNTVWTEYAQATAGDFLLIGESAEIDPVAAGADEIISITQFADTFDRMTDDFALVTGA